MTPEKLLVVTVGTSLFHSASWDEENPVFCQELGKSEAKKYKTEWANPGDNRNLGGLHSPKLRMRNGGALEDRFKEKLKATEKNVARWAEWVALPVEAGALMRYSAEIATILSLAKSESLAAGQTIEEFLAGYAGIYFFYDDDENSLAHIAAKHNMTYLQKMIGATPGKIRSKEIAEFSAETPHKLAQGLRAYRELMTRLRDNNPNAMVDIVISGGYKVYGLIGYGFLSQDRFRIIYLHEEMPEVVIQNKTTFAIPAAGVEIPLPLFT